MSQEIIITHYYHSGFSVAYQNRLFVFDYWRGEEDELKPDMQLTPDKLKKYDDVFVFISHEHIDHLDPVVFTWKDFTNVSYIVSSDMPVGTRGKRMAPRDTLMLCDEVSVTAFDSTDLGVSFLLDLNGIRIFHAGDLNFWHWREESTMKEIEEAEEEFRKAVSPLEKERIDVAFFPVDPRQGSMFDAGANYFILSVKPRLLIPMHYFHRSEVAVEYARTASCRTTEVLAMPGYADSIRLEFDQEGYTNISFLKKETEPSETDDNKENRDTDTDENRIRSDGISDENNPFDESDLPITQLQETETSFDADGQSPHTV